MSLADTPIEEMRFRWRCKRCKTITLLDGRGGNLHCQCAEKHNDFEFMVDRGRFADGEWHDHRAAYHL